MSVVYKVRLDIPDAPDEQVFLVTRLWEERGHGQASCSVYAGDPRFKASTTWENPSSPEPLEHTFKFESKASYEYEIASETTRADEQVVSIKEGQQAFIQGTAPMIHTEGDIYVWRDNRLFLLQGVIADFPLVDPNAWSFYPVYEPIPGWKPPVEGGLGGSEGGTTTPPLESLDPAAAAAAAAAAASVKGGTAGGGKALAQTGTSLDSIVPIGLVGTGLALMGGLFLVLRRRRQQHN